MYCKISKVCSYFSVCIQKGVKPLKKPILKAASIFLTACLLFGCGKTPQETENNIPTSQETKPTISVTVEDETITGQEQNHTENTNSNSEGEKQDDSKDLKDTLQENNNFLLLENYKEKNIPPVYTQENENESYCNAHFNKDGELEYYTLEKKTDGYSFWKYKLKENLTKEAAEESGLWNYKKGMAWVREPVLWLEEIMPNISYGRITLFQGEDGNDYAWYVGEGEKAHLVKREGESCLEIPISNWRITEQATVAVLENGNVVSADAGRECFVYRPDDGSLITSFQCGWYESICVRGNIIYISAPGGASVQRYNAETQEFLPIIEAGFDNSVRIAVQEDKIYVCTPTGIYCAKETDTNFQKIMDAGTFHFAKENGVLLKFFIIGDAFYVVYGEDKVSIKKYAPMKEGEEASKYLTVYSLETNNLILDMISEFENEYPDIELIYETGEGSEGSITKSDQIRALNARILAGDGPDVLLLDGLPVESYIQKGILEDLSPVLGSVKEELLDNILTVYTTEDKIYQLPLRMKFPVFMTSGQSSEVFSTLESLVEYLETGKDVANMGTYAHVLQILYYNYTPDIFLPDGTIHREAVEEFLSLVKRYCELKQITDTRSVATYLKGNNQMAYYFASGEAELAFLMSCGIYELADNPDAVKLRGGELVGNQGRFVPNGLLGINHFSTKKNVCHQFIQFAFSYEIQNRDVSYSGYPIHKKILDEGAKEDISNVTMSIDNTLTLRYFNAEESAQMIQMVKEAHQPVTIEESIWEILLDTSQGYLQGTKELKESVDEMISRLQLYFYEQ